MPDQPTDYVPEDMPAEVDFSGAVRGRHSRAGRGNDTVRINHADGRVEYRQLPPSDRPDRDAFSPDSLRGVVDDVLYYVYNPATDMVTIRLVDSLGDAAVFGEEDRGIRVVTAQATGKAIGLVVRGFLQHHHSDATGQPFTRELLEPGLASLAERLGVGT